MHVCILNIRSIVNKFSKFQSFAYASPYIIYRITETWLLASYFDRDIMPSGYSIYRKDRGPSGGGILIAVNESLAFQEVPTPPHLELAAVLS